MEQPAPYSNKTQNCNFTTNVLSNAFNLLEIVAHFHDPHIFGCPHFHRAPSPAATSVHQGEMRTAPEGSWPTTSNTTAYMRLRGSRSFREKTLFQEARVVSAVLH